MQRALVPAAVLSDHRCTCPFVAVAPPMPARSPARLPAHCTAAVRAPCARADAPRFALGVASGQPRAQRLVLWTRLTGADLPGRGAGALGAGARRGASRDIAARGSETGSRPMGAQRARRARRPRAGALVLVPLRGARASAARSAARAPRRRPMPRQPLRFAIASCQRYDRPLRRVAPHRAAERSTWCCSSATTSTNTRSPPDARCARTSGGTVRTLDEYRARYAQYKSDPRCRPRTRRAVADGVGRPRGRQRLRRPAGPGAAAGLLARSAPRPTSAYWEHMPLPKALTPGGADMRIYGRLDWGALARIHAARRPPVPRLRRPARAPGRGGSNTVRLARLPRAASTRAARCSAPSRSAGSPKAGTCAAAGTCWRSRR